MNAELLLFDDAFDWHCTELHFNFWLISAKINWLSACKGV